MAFDIEQTLLEWLPKKTGYPCYIDVPLSRPDRFVSIERTGGEASIGKDEPLLAVQAWGPTRADASAIALEVRDALILHACEILQVLKCDVTSIYNFPDPDSRQARYQLDVEMITRL